MYDRDHLEEQKILQDCLFAACMNPKAGSFIVDLRLQRHYSLFACLTPERVTLNTIFTQIINSHFHFFDGSIQKLTEKIVTATCEIFFGIANSTDFMPTAKKFHYQFNLRDFSRIVQNMMQTQPQKYNGNPTDMVRLWVHECDRVYQDRLLVEDIPKYKEFMEKGLKQFEGKPEDYLIENNIFTSFVSLCKGHEATLLPIESMEALNKVLEDKLFEYNENVQSMNLVLFDQAMEHICRIARIIANPCGNALLIGVGGSGKQSLSKLAAYIIEYEVARIMVSTTYNMNDLKNDL